RRSMHASWCWQAGGTARAPALYLSFPHSPLRPQGARGASSMPPTPSILLALKAARWVFWGQARRHSTMPQSPSRPVREVRLFSRRAQLPQSNKSKWAAFPGFFHGFRDLDDALKWEIYTYLFAVQTPPPHESVLRCDRHVGFAVHFAEPWLDVVPEART